MSEAHDAGKRCIEEIARGVADTLGLTSIRFEWGREEEHLRFPLRITTDQGVTKPAIRFTISEIDYSCSPANEDYHKVQRRITTALQQLVPPDEGRDVIVHYIRIHDATTGNVDETWSVWLGTEKQADCINLQEAMDLARELAQTHQRRAWLLDAGGYPLKPIDV